jgi:hypothetical protein
MVSARYIRINITNNTSNQAAHILETKVYGVSLPQYSAAFIYGCALNSDSLRAYTAANYDLVVLECSGWDYAVSEMQQLKTLNPNLLLFGYVMTAQLQQYRDDFQTINTQHETWFLHNINGTRIYDTSTGAYLMDISNSEYMAYMASYINTKMASNPHYTGVFLDNCFNSLPTSWIPWSVPNNTFKSTDISSWHSNVLAFLTYLKAYVQAKIIINSDSGITDYVAIVDGVAYNETETSINLTYQGINYSPALNTSQWQAQPQIK